MDENGKARSPLLAGKLHEVEHALLMHAYSFVQFPAKKIYDDDYLSPFRETIKRCHIYLVGFLPIVNFVDARQEDRRLIVTLSLLGAYHDIEWPLPDGYSFHCEDGVHYVLNENAERMFPTQEDMLAHLSQNTGKLNFNIKYIGQAYGKEGSRNALDRLRKHETLQKISIQGVPDGYELQVLLLEIQPVQKLLTIFNPHASNKEQSDERMEAGIDKLFDTNEQERITLYEASLIRYFMPKFNKEFKNSFPSTNMKILGDCYDKDFSAVVAEILFDEFPYLLCSDVVEPKHHHIAGHDLHKEADRKVFFSRDLYPH